MFHATELCEVVFLSELVTCEIPFGPGQDCGWYVLLQTSYMFSRDVMFWDFTLPARVLVLRLGCEFRIIVMLETRLHFSFNAVTAEKGF